MSIADNINLVQSNIIQAQKGRNPSCTGDVRLIAVTKTLSADAIRPAYDCGIRDFGENRVQELTAKFPLFPKDLRWHLIGHLQTNKVKYIIDKAAMIHSLDSIKLAAEIEKRAAAIDRIMPCLVQVNIAGEDTKSGLAPEEVRDLVEALGDYSHVAVEGLMTIGPHTDDKAAINDVFRRCKDLQQQLNAIALPNVKMKELSMGMSADYEDAVRQGATMVRVGTVIFGPRG